MVGDHRIAQGEWVDSSVENPVHDLIEVLSQCQNPQLVQLYGIWLAQHEPAAAFGVSVSDAYLRPID